MSYIKSVEIKKLWGVRDLKLRIDRDVNFLVGRNGTGKTTVVGLIAATLIADLAYLDRYDYEYVDFFLDNPRTQVRSEKITDENGRQEVRVSFRHKSNDRFSPIASSGRGSYFSEWSLINGEPQRSRKRVDAPRLSVLNDLASVTWLSVHRGTLGRRFESSDGIESTVDKKLGEVCASFG